MLSMTEETTDVLDMLKVLTKQNHTIVDINNWILPLDDIGDTEHHDSDYEDLDLNTNKTVKNDDAVQCVNT